MLGFKVWRSLSMAVEYHCCQPQFFFHIAIIVLLVVFAGMMSGLTLGLMSMSLVDLEVLAKSGTPKDRKHAGSLFLLSPSFVLFLLDLDFYSIFSYLFIYSPHYLMYILCIIAYVGVLFEVRGLMQFLDD